MNGKEEEQEERKDEGDGERGKTSLRYFVSGNGPCFADIFSRISRQHD